MGEVGGGEERELLGFTYLIVCFPLDCLCLYCLLRSGIPPTESMCPCGDVQIVASFSLCSFADLAFLSPARSEGGLEAFNLLTMFLLYGKETIKQRIEENGLITFLIRKGEC